MNNEKLQQILFLYSDNKLKTVSEDLIACLINDENSRRCVAGKLQQMISVSSSRQKGIELLNVCLPKLSPEIIAEYGINWIKYCLNFHDENQQKELYLNTVANIINYSQSNAEFSKKFVTDHLHVTLDSTLKNTSNLYIKKASLLCLIACLSNYPNSCNSYRTKIEDYLVGCLSISSEEIISLSGSAYFYNLKVGNAGINGVNHVKNISLSLRRITATCHKLYDSIFEHIGHTEFEQYEMNTIEPFTILDDMPLHYNAHLKLEWMVQTLKNFLNWLIIFLRKGSTKVMHPKELLDIIYRAINMHTCLEQDSLSVELLHFASSLISIQIQTLKVLATLIQQMDLLLAPFYHIITRIIDIIIKRNHSCSCYKNHLMQEYVYDVVAIWLRIGGDSFQKSLQNILISSLTKDAFPETSSFTLKKNVTIQQTGQGKVKSMQDQEFGVKTCNNSSASANNELILCMNGLNMLHILLNYSYLSVSKSVLIKLYKAIVKTIQIIQRGQAVFPYSDQKIEVILYKVVCSIFEQDSLGVLPPIQVVINQLRVGCSSENQEIASVCFEGLKNLEKICQPYAPSLYLSSSNIVEDESQEPLLCLNNYENAENELNTNKSKKIDRCTSINIIDNSVVVPRHTNMQKNLIITKDSNKNSNIDGTQNYIHINESIVQGDNQVNYIQSNGSSNMNTRLVHKDEPAVKKQKIENTYESNMTNSLVDLVNDDYE